MTKEELHSMARQDVKCIGPAVERWRTLAAQIRPLDSRYADLNMKVADALDDVVAYLKSRVER